MSDIALGLKEQSLVAFADGLNASYMSQLGRAFRQAISRILEATASFHFNRTGLNITEALLVDPAHRVGRSTAWEFQQIVRCPTWLRCCEESGE